MSLDRLPAETSLAAGTNNIGDVDVLTLPSLVAGTANIGDVDVLTLPALIAGTANIGDVDVLTVPSPLSTTGGGTEATAHRVTIANDSTGLVSIDDNSASLTVDAPVATPVAARLSDGAAFLTTTSGRLSVDASGVAVPVTDNAGSLTVDQATAANLNAQVVGSVADAAADSGNPLKVGLVGRTTNRTAVTDGQRVNASADDVGRQVVTLHQVRDLVTDATTTISTTTETTILAAGAAGVFHDLLSIIAINTSATAVRVDIRDATAGQVKCALYLPAGDTRGFVLVVPKPQTTAANNWTAQLSAAVTDVRIWIQAVKNV